MVHDESKTLMQKLPVWARIGLAAAVVVVLMAAILVLPGRAHADADAAATGEILIFDWNRVMTMGMSGFAQCKPVEACKLPGNKPMPNGDWSSYKNGGTLWMRANVRSMPKGSTQPGMQLEICFWQTRPKYGEECTTRNRVPGIPGTDVVWSQPFNDIWDPYPIDWTQPRWKEGVVVRNAGGRPVSKKVYPAWSGENPKKWYPIDLRFTVVLVPEGGSEPDWTKYGW